VPASTAEPHNTSTSVIDAARKTDVPRIGVQALGRYTARGRGEPTFLYWWPRAAIRAAPERPSVVPPPAHFHFLDQRTMDSLCEVKKSTCLLSCSSHTPSGGACSEVASVRTHSGTSRRLVYVWSLVGDVWTSEEQAELK
jgi:hypothetical protein